MIEEVLSYEILNNTVGNYFICGGVFLAGIIGVKIFKKVFLIRLKKWVKGSSSTLDDFLVGIIEKAGVPLLYFGTFYVSMKLLVLEPGLDKNLGRLGVGVLTFFVGQALVKIINYGLKTYWKQTGQTQALEHSLSGILKVAKFVVWALAVIFYLDNLGFKVTTVMAGLGVGGVAVALAAQAVLKDLFSYFSIIFDRPFEIGDFIIIGEHLGTVEHIGVKTTRIRSLGGEQLVFSNSDLTDSRLRNYKRMEKRRVVFKLGVVYGTALKELKEIPEIIERVIKKVGDTIFDRAHFFAYGDFNLVFEVVYYVLSSDYNKYMDIQQEINFGIKEEFEKRNIEFAFPTQTVYLNRVDRG